MFKDTPDGYPEFFDGYCDILYTDEFEEKECPLCGENYTDEEFCPGCAMPTENYTHEIITK